MSTNQEIQRIQQAKADLKEAIQNQGVSVPDSAKIDEYNELIKNISTVRSVANVLPDETGNVNLTVADIDGVSDVQIGTVTTGEPGEPASVTSKKENSIAKLNFVIPKGDKGEQGLQGDKGDKGDTPVKGTDYWTDADKSDIANEVVAQLSVEHKYITKNIYTDGWVTSADNIHTYSFTDNKIPAGYKLDISLCTDDLLNLMNDGVGSIRTDNEDGIVNIVAIGEKPLHDITAQISFVKLVQA